MKRSADRISYTALIVTIALFLIACIHLEYLKKTTEQLAAVREMPNALPHNGIRYGNDPATLLPLPTRGERRNARFKNEATVVVRYETGSADGPMSSAPSGGTHGQRRTPRFAWPIIAGCFVFLILLRRALDAPGRILTGRSDSVIPPTDALRKDRL